MTSRTTRAALPALLCAALTFGAGALANEFPMDGNWIGRGYTQGADECPRLELNISVAGHQAIGKFSENQGHTVEMRFEVEEDGEFSGTIRTRSGHNVRITGELDGKTWKGYLHHSVCQGSWHAERETAPAPAQAVAAAPAATLPAAPAPGLEDQLRSLQELRQKDLIDEETYRARRAALLDKLLADSGGDASVQAAAQPAAPLSTEGIDFGRYFALVIANNDYQSLPDLDAAVPDGKAVAGLLRKSYGFEVELLIDARRYDIITALSRYRGLLGARDNLLIYYAGHGVLDRDAEQGYWVPIDGDRDNPANWVANSDVTAAIRALKAKHVMLVVDSCYSGTLTRAIDTGRASEPDRLAWFKRMAGKQARTVLTSGGLEPVMDAGGDGHSVFARAFLQALGGNTGVLDGQSLFANLKRPVVVNAAQTPEYSDLRFVGHDGGDFLFVKR